MKSHQHRLAATQLQKLIATNASEAMLWTCCFLDREGKLILGVKPGSDIKEQLRIASTAVGEIGITVVQKTFVRHANKQVFNRPVIGGIQILVPDLQAAGSTGVVVVLDDVLGVITAGHVVGAIGAHVYQPRQSDHNNWEIGDVTCISNYGGAALSDSAFVQLNDGVGNTQWRVWKTANLQYTVTDTQIAQVGDDVSMQGASTQATERSGVICSVDATVRFEDGGVLSQQYLATYLTRVGDSGAPVYIKGPNPNIVLIGINVGGTAIDDIEQGAPDPATYPPNADGMYAVISKWENVLADLFED